MTFQLKPMIPTLLALGGLNRIVMLNTGDIYSLFTAPLLHESVMHLVWEGIAFYLSASFWKNMPRRLWLLRPVCDERHRRFRLVPFPHAGADKHMLEVPVPSPARRAAAYILSFRLRSVGRKSVQLRILWAVIVTLLPFVLTASRHLPVNFAAPLGGGLTGALFGWLLVKTWRTPNVPPLMETGAADDSNRRTSLSAPVFSR